MKTFFVILTVAILTWSCDKNVFDKKDYEIKSIEATPTEALPLAFGDLSIADVLSNKDSAYIKVDPVTDLVYLNYDQVLISQGVGDLVVIPDKTNVSRSSAVPSCFPLPCPPSASDVILPVQSSFVALDIAPEQLTEILMKSGTVSCDVVTSPNNPNLKYAIKIDVPEFTIAGTTTPLAFETTGASNSFSLANYVYKSARPDTITLNVTLIIKKNPNAVTIAPGTMVNATIAFKGMDYKYVKGFLGQQSIDLPAETLNIQAFGTSFLNGASVSFKQPKIEFNIVNEIGVPATIYFTSLEARKPGASLLMEILPASPIVLAVPVMGGSAINPPIVVTNADALLKFKPTQFYYKANVHINEGKTVANSGYNNFVTDTSKLNIHMHVEVPLYGHASNIKLADTLSYDLSDADQSQILSAALKIKTTNQIPLSANVQFYLTDDNYKVLDSLLSPDKTNIIKGSSVNASGELATAGVVDETITLSKDKLDKLFQATKIIIRAKINTSQDANGNYPDVKFKSAYKMNIKLGLQINGKIKVDL